MRRLGGWERMRLGTGVRESGDRGLRAEEERDGSWEDGVVAGAMGNW